jgi:hypothetical protein
MHTRERKISARMNSGSVQSSLQTLSEIYATLPSLVEYLHTYAILNLDLEKLKVEPYYMQMDGRIGWKQTYSVSCPHYGIMAFTNGPLNEGVSNV